MFAGRNRFFQHGLPLMGDGGIEKYAEACVRQGPIEIDSPFGAVSFGQGREPFGVAPGQHETRNDAVAADREPALITNRHERIGDMLGGADAAGGAVQNDADRGRGHG